MLISWSRNDPPRSQRKPILLVDKRGEGSSSTPKRVAGTVSVGVHVTPVPTTSVSPSKRQPRRGAKAEAEAKLERLKTYAKNRFDDLNSKVFENKIPATTKIEWNNRLRSTAGKASYQRWVWYSLRSSHSHCILGTDKVWSTARLNLQSRYWMLKVSGMTTLERQWQIICRAHWQNFEPRNVPSWELDHHW